jgi:hypothetical protein
MTVVKPLSPVNNSTDQSTKTSDHSDNSTPPHSSGTSAPPNTAVYPATGTGLDHQAPAKEELTQSPIAVPSSGSASSSTSVPSSGSVPLSGSASVSPQSTVRSTSPASKPTLNPEKGSAATGEPETANRTGAANGKESTNRKGTANSPETANRAGTADSPETANRAGTADSPESANRTVSAPTGRYGLAPAPRLADSKTNSNAARWKGKSHPIRMTSPGSTGSDGSTGASGSKDADGSAGLTGSKDPHESPGSAGTRGSRSPNYTQGPSGSIAPPREPAFSTIQDAHSLARQRGVDDSALRAASVSGVAGSIRLDKKNPFLRISRPLQFGLSLSPDFASVHSLAGDRPGSSIGLTLDYQFSDRWYISTGLLLTRKNYASSPQDYHVPNNYYMRNNIHDVSLIKGSFYMLEIPLNLRYDFLLTGNTVFFLSGGASSYLMTSEHSQYYYNLFGRQTCQDFKGEETRRRNYLFSSINLSMGVETGLSNSLSLLIAPYVKVPTAGMGFGQVQITSVGLNFALKYAPVLSRKRQH